MITTRVYSETLKAYNKGYRIIANRGGSRSGKTFSKLQLDYNIMSLSKKQRVLTTVSYSFPHLHSGAIRDFEKILTTEDVNIDKVRTQNPHIYRIGNSLSEFIGFDKPGKALGAARDILFINEANKLPFTIAHQLMQRTTECIFLDWNPSEDFWFDTEGFAERKDCIVIDSNFFDNIQNLSHGQLDEFKNAQRKAEAEDKAGKRGYWWNWWQVYGLGKKGQLEGVIFQNWQEYTDLPDCDLYKLWVIDWGGLDPTTVTELNFDGENNRLYIREHIYQPQILNSKLIEFLHANATASTPVICDSARKDKIFELQMAGITAFGATKGEGSIIDGIERLQEFDIFIHKDSKNAIFEFRNYKRVQDQLTGKYLDIPEDKNNHCFIGSTLIETKEGLKSIDFINEFDSVLTRNGYFPVIHKFNNGLKQVYKYLMQFDNFSLSLTCTKDHKIYTNIGWVQILELKSGMMVFLSKNLTENYIDCIQKNDIFPEVQKGCTLKFGSFITAALKKVFVFIIKTIIHGITQLIIWSLKKNQSIKLNTANNALQTILNGLNLLTKKVERRQKNGTVQLKVLNGIKSKVQKHGLVENLKLSHVDIVEKNIKQDTQDFQNFAGITVKHVHCENVGVMQVYDIMVNDNHEYYANGILVHNCIDPVRYGARFYRRSVKPL